MTPLRVAGTKTVRAPPNGGTFSKVLVKTMNPVSSMGYWDSRRRDGSTFYGRDQYEPGWFRNGILATTVLCILLGKALGQCQGCVALLSICPLMTGRLDRCLQETMDAVPHQGEVHLSCLCRFSFSQSVDRSSVPCSSFYISRSCAIKTAVKTCPTGNKTMNCPLNSTNVDAVGVDWSLLGGVEYGVVSSDQRLSSIAAQSIFLSTELTSCSSKHRLKKLVLDRA